MTIVYRSPQYAPNPDGGNSFRFFVKPEQWRVAVYAFFWGMALLAKFITNRMVLPMLAAGAVDEPPERQGCGPFNRGFDRENKLFDLDYGDGFALPESHLSELFGFNNICVSWDYSPAREIISMYFPLFEYSLLIYLLLDFVNTALSYKRGELPNWYWKFSKVIFPINMIFASWFRLITVFIAYEQPRYHTTAFLGIQIALFLLATNNFMYILITGQSYPKIGLTPRKTAVFATVYIIINVAINFVKIYGTLYIVLHPHTLSPDFYKFPTPIPGMVLGQVVDKIWLLFNGVFPGIIAYVRMKEEDPFHIDISVPKHLYEGDSNDSGETETAGLLKGDGK